MSSSGPQATEASSSGPPQDEEGSAKLQDARVAASTIYTSVGSPVLLCPSETTQIRLRNFVLERSADPTAVPGTQSAGAPGGGLADINGVVCVTNYRLFFIDDAASVCHCSFPMQTVEKLVKQRNVFEFLCKDFRMVRLRMEFDPKRTAEENEAVWKQAYYAFVAHIFPKPPHHVFAYSSVETFPVAGGPPYDGWRVYDACAEYARLGIPDTNVRLTDTNDGYQLCDTYPRVLAVPHDITDQELLHVAHFRSRRRVPVVSWRHSGNGTLLMRSAQPLVGVTRSRCTQDEKLIMSVAGVVPPPSSDTASTDKDDALEIRTIAVGGTLVETPVRSRRVEELCQAPASPEPAAANTPDDRSTSDSSRPSSYELVSHSRPMTGRWGAEVGSMSILPVAMSPAQSPSPRSAVSRHPTASASKPLYILDARPLMNAGAQKIKGAGFELIEYYKNCKLEFLGVDNIHEMRKSFHQLRSLIVRQHENAELAATKWLEHICIILGSAVRAVALLEAGHSVLVHCSDGWDRTCQLVSLAMLMLDPYYRTREGFIVLIEKEWLSFGHRFMDRCMSGEQSDKKEFSPVFLQFIDCVWQIWQQYPSAFEFNCEFLLEIMEHVWSCRFGTFLMNCEKERAGLHHLPSLWGYMESVSERFVNVYYTPNAPATTLKPTANSKCLQLWSEYYLRFDLSIPVERLRCPRDAAADVLAKRIRQLESQLEPGLGLKGRRPSKMHGGRSPVPGQAEVKLMGPERTPLLQSTMEDDILGDLDLDHVEDIVIETLSGGSSDEDDTDEDAFSAQATSTPPVQPLAVPHSRPSAHLVLDFPQHSTSPPTDPAPHSQGPVKWMPDNAVSECFLCRRAFTAMRRKHHCRRCGYIFCYQCTQHSRILPHVSPKPVRVCVRCFLETPQNA